MEGPPTTGEGAEPTGLGLLRASILTVGARGAGVLLSVATGVVVARALGPVGKGALSYLSTLTTLSARAASLGLEGAFTHVHHVHHVDRGVAIGTLVRSITVLGVAAAALAQLAVSAFPGVTAGLPVTLVRASLATVPAAMLVSVFSFVLFGLHRERAFAAFDIGYRGFTLALQGLVLVLIGRELAPVVWGQVITTVVFAALALAILWRAAGCRFAWSAPVAGQMARFGVGYFAYTTVRYALVYGGVLMSAWYLSVADAGVFSVAQMIVEVIALLSGSVNLAFYPAVAGSRDPHAYTRTTALRLSLVSAVAGGALAVLAGPAVGLLYGVAFVAAVPAFLWMLPGAVLLTAEQTVSSYLATTQRLWPATLALSLGVVAQLALAMLLAPRYGLAGLGVAVSTGQAVATGGVSVAFARVGASGPVRDR